MSMMPPHEIMRRLEITRPQFKAHTCPFMKHPQKVVLFFPE